MDYHKQQILNPYKLFLARSFSRVTGSFYPRKDANCPVDPQSIKKILVIEHQCIGDVLMLEPALTALRSFYRYAELHLLCVPAIKELAERAGFADKIFAFPAETPFEIPYDILFGFHGDVRHIHFMRKFRTRYLCGFSFSGGARYLTHVIDYPYQKHQVERPFALLSAMDVPVRRRVPEINLFQNVKKIPECVLLHPGAEHPARRWPRTHWETLSHLLQKDGKEVLWILPPAENAPEHIAHVRGSLFDVAARIASAALLVGCDSMAVHLAVAIGTPALALFGSQSPELTRPYGPLGHVILPPGACRHTRSNWRLCPACMACIEPDAVLQSIRDILNQ
ncbi:MAG: glycosyltransferase family 9 protein [FCB group bacterium]|nr:glycosyltransferase family 9 protein [FCB group bacterium]